MADRRRYTKRQKLAAVMAAEVSGVTVAGEQTGIPKTTIQYWVTRPEFAQFRTKTREDMAEEVKVVAHLAWKRIAETLRSGEMEPRDAIFAADKATTIQLLMTGQATSRTETVSVTDGLDADTKRKLRARLARSVRGESEPDRAAGDPERAGEPVDTAPAPGTA